MAHARRKFHDVHVRTPTVVTTEALRRFGELYAIEAEIRGSPAAERLAVRREKSVPLMASLDNWWREQAAVMSSASGLKGAFTYLENNWDALNEFCRNGWVEIEIISPKTPCGWWHLAVKITCSLAQPAEVRTRRSCIR
ncbi:transposase [Salmonella enterica]|nr:transposase [Salmonella enterica]